ncbi:capsule assembly Wzi family protein [Thermonema rossianum]|uniref:capsule assembly Wzi family protein n=1 Tax=Thermonema rossianum TaxID=55505 RepID=UPI000570403C|nr:capsule assembly Wzi family protein [Thermonema rossianum]
MTQLIRIFLAGCLLSGTLLPSYAQAPLYDLDEDYTHLLRRYELKGKRWDTLWHYSQLPASRQAVLGLLRDSSRFSSTADRFNRHYLQRDNWDQSDSLARLYERKTAQGFWGHFYRQPAALYSAHVPGFRLAVNPVLDFQAGKDSRLEAWTYQNTRGVRLRGSINDRLSFFTYLTDTQARYPLYVQQYVDATRALPHEGYFKDGDRPSPTTYDFLSARGYVAFRLLPSVEMQFGHDRNFIGYGKRSLILSDFAAPYTFLKITTRVWKLQYQNLFAEMVADVSEADGLRPKKYFAFHHLSAYLTPRLEIGLFESVVFGRQGGFELHYLNPIIFYRSVEQHVGSPDNVILGGDFRWMALPRLALYGQVVIDELVVSEVRSGKGWWGNKQALQLGLHYVDAFGIDNLDLQGEVNMVRPYTYTQDTLTKAYTHYRQPLAHPAGANFYELLGVVRYQPLPRWRFEGQWFYIVKGEDRPGENWGGNILLDNRSRVQDYGNHLAQGVRTTTALAELRASCQVYHNVFLEASYLWRQVKQDTGTRTNTSFVSVGLRMNAARRRAEF